MVPAWRSRIGWPESTTPVTAPGNSTPVKVGKSRTPGGESQSKRHLVAGKQSAGHLNGIEMQRHGDVIQMVQYDVDLNNPKNSVVAEMKHVWVRFQARLGAPRRQLK